MVIQLIHYRNLNVILRFWAWSGLQADVYAYCTNMISKNPARRREEPSCLTNDWCLNRKYCGAADTLEESYPYWSSEDLNRYLVGIINQTLINSDDWQGVFKMLFEILGTRNRWWNLKNIQGLSFTQDRLSRVMFLNLRILIAEIWVYSHFLK